MNTKRPYATSHSRYRTLYMFAEASGWISEDGALIKRAVENASQQPCQNLTRSLCNSIKSCPHLHRTCQFYRSSGFFPRVGSAPNPCNRDFGQLTRLLSCRVFRACFMLPLASRSTVQPGVQVLAPARRIASVNAGIMRVRF
jgi:hypothetical protein